MLIKQPSVRPCGQQRSVVCQQPVNPCVARALVRPVTSFVTLAPDAACDSTSVSSRCAIVASAGKGFGASTKKKVDAGMDASLPCPCGSGQSHAACCQPFISKASKVTTPEQLLRSRYSAYAIKNADYIADTTHPDSEEYTGSRSSYLQSVRSTQRRADWLALKINKQEPGATPNDAFIYFRADFVDQNDKSGKRNSREEKSRFWRDSKGQWFYMGSDLLEDTQAKSAIPTIQLPSFNILGNAKLPL